MPISVTCSCGKRLRVADEMIGKKVRCPGCKALLTTAPPSEPRPSGSGSETRSLTVAAQRDAPKAKKSSAKLFLLLGCGCLTLVGGGIAAVVVTIIVAAASHKSYKDKLVGEWVLDPAESKRLNMDVPRSYADIRSKFDKDGTCLLHCENRDVPKSWQIVSEKNRRRKPAPGVDFEHAGGRFADAQQDLFLERR
jgi:hypothetical protein